MIQFILNDKLISTALPPGTALLDLVRYDQHLTGTKIGCREGDCGACTVLAGELINGSVHYETMTSCLMPLGNANGKHIVTIEGINFPNELNPIQLALAEEGATQCGFCTPGFVVSMAGYCLRNTSNKSSAIACIDGNICRCTGYKSIERALHKLEGIISERKNESPAEFVTRKKILPAYFKNIPERLSQLKVKSPSEATGALVTGGGTDLYVQKHEEMVHAPIHFLFDLPELTTIRKEGNKCILGPSVTVTDLLQSPILSEIFPKLADYLRLVSSTPIRNMATLAGNFVNASPIGDMTIFFLALDAQLELTPAGGINGNGNIRKIALREFYKGYKQLDKSPAEIISSISFEWPGNSTLFNFEKVSKRTHLDIASVNSAICLEMKNGLIQKAGLSAGGVGPIPLFLKKTSAFLENKKINRKTIEESISICKEEITPISDVRGSKEYKRLLLGQLIKAHFTELFHEEY